MPLDRRYRLFIPVKMSTAFFASSSLPSRLPRTKPLHTSRINPAPFEPAVPPPPMTKLITRSLLEGHTLHRLVMKWNTFGRAEGWRDVVVRMDWMCAAECRVCSRSCVFESRGGCGGGFGTDASFLARRGRSESESLSDGSSSVHVAACFPLLFDAEGSRLPTGRESIREIRNVRYIERVGAVAFGKRAGPKASRFASKCVRPSWDGD